MWKDLTLQQKAEIMKMSVANGVTDINNIQQLYDGSLEHKFKGGGYKSSASMRKRISDWEGSSMYKPAPDTGKVNRPFSAEEKDFWRVIPDDIKPLLTQDMADALFSTSYNIGAGNFKKRVVPNLIKVFREGTGTVEDITRSMYGKRDSEPKMRGLRTRRATERSLFTNAYNAAYGKSGSTSGATNTRTTVPSSTYQTSMDIPTQGIQWETPSTRPTAVDYSNYLTNIIPPKVEIPKITSIEERVPISETLPDMPPILSYLPDQQEVAPRRMVLPQYEPISLDFNTPYILFRG